MRAGFSANTSTVRATCTNEEVYRTEAEAPHKGWYSRGFLPHRDDAGLIHSVTFRMADSLPQEILNQLETELESLPKDRIDIEKRRRSEAWLDAGMGCCALRHPLISQKVQDSILYFHGQRYYLHAWCIMPNHVHVLLEPLVPLASILQSWKSYTGRWALSKNAELELGVPGKAFWMREYWDRFIRNENHYKHALDYIHNNPVKARLCSHPKDWQWSSYSRYHSKDAR